MTFRIDSVPGVNLGAQHCLALTLSLGTLFVGDALMFFESYIKNNTIAESVEDKEDQA